VNEIGQGTLTEGGRLRTVDLLMKVAGFVNRTETSFTSSQDSLDGNQLHVIMLSAFAPSTQTASGAVTIRS